MRQKLPRTRGVLREMINEEVTAGTVGGASHRQAIGR
jgi:hypothetical protein